MTEANTPTRLDAEKISIDSVRLVRSIFDLTDIELPVDDAEVLPYGMSFEINRDESDPLNQSVRLRAWTDEESTLPFSIDVCYEGWFSCEPENTEHLRLYMRYNAPTVLVPYIRELMSNLSVRAAYAPFLMPPVNVPRLVADYEKTQKAIASEAAAGSTEVSPPD